MISSYSASQRTAEWYRARLGKVTASRVAEVMAKTSRGYGLSRKHYMRELLYERETGRRRQHYVSSAMRWGIAHEPEARAVYAREQDVPVIQTGFIVHPSIPMAGASPDGLIGRDGMLEIKCPGTERHVDTIVNGRIHRRYVLQMQFQMMCARRTWDDFASYDPRMPEDLMLYVKRFEYDDALAAEITREVTIFLEELAAAEKERMGKSA